MTNQFYTNLFAFFVLLVLAQSVSVAQEFNWLSSTQSPDVILGNSIATDGVGSLYVTGSYLGKATINGKTLPNNGDQDIFVAKYTNKGKMEWIVSAGGPEQDLPFSILCDPKEGVYITGFFHDECEFGDTILSGKKNDQVFLAKLSFNGEFEWVKQAGSYNQNWGKSLAIDEEGMIYISGKIGADASFEDTTVKASFSMFLAKYSPNGELIFAESGHGRSDCNAIATIEDHVYVTGAFSNYLDLGGQVVTKTGRNDCFFVACLDRNRKANWIYVPDTLSNSTGTAIAIDNQGDVCLTYRFRDSTIIDGKTYIAHGSSDLIMAQFNQQGEVIWHRQLGGLNLWQDKSLVVDKDNSIYITGTLVESEYFDEHNFVAIDQDAFIAKFTTKGEFDWLLHGQGNYQDQGEALCYSSVSNSLFCLGNFGETINFGETVLHGVGNDFYLGEIQIGPGSYDLNVFPNPTDGKLMVNMNGEGDIKVWDLQGRLVIDKSTDSGIDLSNQPDGLYILQISTKEGILNKKICKFSSE